MKKEVVQEVDGLSNTHVAVVTTGVPGISLGILCALTTGQLELL